MITQKKLCAAVIGAGMGRYGILPAFLLNNRIHVVAVCTRHPETAAKFAKEYNIPRAYYSWEALLEEDLDIVAIATPPTVQAEITQAFLKKKVAVFLEKQIAKDVCQSQTLQELAMAHQVPSCVNFIFPYLHTWRRLRAYLENGALGQLRHIFLNWRMESYDNCQRTPSIWKTNDGEGGGVLQHFLSHSFHYIESLFGEIEELRCTLSSAPDLCATGSSAASLDLVLKNQVVVHLAASNSAYAGMGHQLEIYGSAGSLLLKNEDHDPVLGFKLYYAPRGRGMELVEVEAAHYGAALKDSRVAPTSYLTNAFIDSLEGKSVRHPTIVDGHRTQVLLHYATVANEKRGFVKVVSP